MESKGLQKEAASKYERGEISIDFETLCEIADSLHIHVEQFLYPRRRHNKRSRKRPRLFRGADAVLLEIAGISRRLNMTSL